MKTLHILILTLIALVTNAATVTGTIKNAFGQPVKCSIAFTMLARPGLAPGELRPGWAVVTNTAADGTFALELFRGDYAVQCGVDPADKFWVTIPDTADVYSIDTISRVVTNNYPLALTVAAGDTRYAVTNRFQDWTQPQHFNAGIAFDPDAQWIAGFDLGLFVIGDYLSPAIVMWQTGRELHDINNAAASFHQLGNWANPATIALLSNIASATNSIGGLIFISSNGVAAWADARFALPAITNRFATTNYVVTATNNLAAWALTITNPLATTNFVTNLVGAATNLVKAWSSNAVFGFFTNGISAWGNTNFIGSNTVMGSNALVIRDDQKRVGIGTNGPRYDLEVGGSGNILAQTAYFVGNPSAAKAGIFKWAANDTAYLGTWSESKNYVIGGSGVILNVGESGSELSSAKTGIGTNNPQTRLHVVGTLRFDRAGNGTPTVPGTVEHWVPVNINGTNGFIPFYK